MFKRSAKEAKKLIDIFGEQTFRPILYANQLDTQTHTQAHEHVNWLPVDRTIITLKCRAFIVPACICLCVCRSL